MHFYLLRAVLAFVLSQASLANADANRDFEQLLDDHWQTSLQEKIGFRGDPDAWRLGGSLASVTPQARARRQAFNEQVLQRLTKIAARHLSAENRVSYKVFRYEREAEHDSYQQLDHLYPLTNRSGWHLSFANAPAGMTFSTLKDYQAYLESLADYPRYNDEHIALLKDALAAGHTQFCASMEGFEMSISSSLVSNVNDSEFYRPLAKLPASLPEENRRDIELRGRLLIEEGILPAYQKLLRFYLEDYAPQCRTVEGITKLPGGEAYYDYLLRYFTTTDMTAQEIHQLGLTEVDRIRAEMEAIIMESGFKGSFSEFLLFLRTDPQFYTDDPEDLLEKTARVAKRMDGQLPRLFATLPRLPYDIQEIPASIAEKTTGPILILSDSVRIHKQLVTGLEFEGFLAEKIFTFFCGFETPHADTMTATCQQLQ